MITVIVSYGKLARKLEPNGEVFTVHPSTLHPS
jgi:hypothetical protein